MSADWSRYEDDQILFGILEMMSLKLAKVVIEKKVRGTDYNE